MTDITNFSTRGVPSWKVEGWVRNNSVLTGTAFLVALTVASMHSATRGYAFPSLATLSRASRVSMKTTQRALDQMKESGEWVIDPGRGGKVSTKFAPARANRYYPTPKLAGISEEESIVHETTDSSLVSALNIAGVPESLHADYQVIHDVLPEKYQTDFIEQIADTTYGTKVTRINKLVSEYHQHYDLEEMIKQRLLTSTTEPTVIISWLSTWGLRKGNHEKYAKNSLNLDYGSSGVDF